jgi:hypothetical protein
MTNHIDFYPKNRIEKRMLGAQKLPTFTNQAKMKSIRKTIKNCKLYFAPILKVQVE